MPNTGQVLLTGLRTSTQPIPVMPAGLPTSGHCRGILIALWKPKTGTIRIIRGSPRSRVFRQLSVMPFHEFMWRGDITGWFSTRKADIQTIYENPTKTIPLMKKYNATLLYVGDAEHERYNVSLPPPDLRRFILQITLIYTDSRDNREVRRAVDGDKKSCKIPSVHKHLFPLLSN